MSEEQRLVATASQTVGPFFHFALTAQPNARMADRFPAGSERIALRIRVVDGDGQPVTDAMIELWQAGVFGRMASDHDGVSQFETVRPSSTDGSAGHIDMYLFARGLLRPLHTRIYFSGDPALEGDATLAIVPEDRRHTLLARAEDGGGWAFEVRLQGSGETVFFDA